jgi:predicted nucleotidyltransferase
MPTARTPTTNKKRAVASKPRVSSRRTRERRASYRAPRWKIPDITPIGSDEPVSKTLPRAVKRIAETLHPEKIILFGSYAYGNPTPDSDVDLLVVMKTDATSANRSWEVSRLMIPRRFAVDILVRTPQEIKSALNNGDFFIQEITERGRTLYERRARPARVG